jgi:hypothetical protein
MLRNEKLYVVIAERLSMQEKDDSLRAFHVAFKC